MSVVFEFPPSDSCKIRVNFESRYGICALCVVLSVEHGEKKSSGSYLAVCERIDDHTKRTQTLVDFLGFLQRLTSGASLANLFASRQIDKVQSARLCRAFNRVLLVDVDHKERMRT